INPNKILSISLNTQNQLEITLDTTYNKYTLENSSNVFIRNNKLIVNNLDLYTGISISETNLNNIEKYVQDYINRDSNRLTEVEFANKIPTYAFKNEIAKGLGTDSSNISEILFDGSTLKILPKSKSKFITTRGNDSLIDGNIIVKNFTFFNITRLTNLNFLYNAINNYIIDPLNKFTPSQFRLDIAANKSNIKNKVAQNLYLGTGSTINVSEILDVSLNDVDQFEITLSSNQKKYELEQNGNVALVGTNKLVVSDLNFYTEIVFENSTLNNLLANIQTFIDSKLSTRSEFIGQLSTNEFKQKVSEFLSVKIDTIGQMAYGDTYLEINPANRFKFSSRTASNLIVNDGIHLEGLKFYDEVNLVNLFKIYDSINNYIIDESRKLTPEEFKNELKSDTSEIRTTIADAINISSSGKIESSQITNLVLNANNELEITLSSNYIRYVGQSTENVVLSNNKLVIKNLTFYTRIAISDSVLSAMRTNINDYIKGNGIQGSVESINSDELFNLIQTVKTEDNKNLGIYIDAPSLSNGTVKIPFKPLVKMEPKVLQDIEVTTNNILIKNLSMSPSDNYFIWDAKTPTKIIGLSDLGKKQTSITLPEKATEISDDVFMNNTNVISIDMSDTKIISIPDGWVDTGTFSGCTNLETITLPDDLESIGLSAFHGCSKLNNIKSKQKVTSDGNGNSNISKTTTVIEKNGLPSKLKTIAHRAFRYCSSLSQIELPENLTSIGMGAFARSGLTSITIPNSITSIPQNAFQYCKSLTKVILSSKLTSIGLQAFADCDILAEINIPDSIVKIDTLAFQYSQKIELKVSTESMKTKVEGFNLALANGNNAIVVATSNSEQKPSDSKIINIWKK
ncbi:MAG: leucine-rich repeat domain-containing protein, partial [Ureaplasma sp.]|nr:leucine-rich repeat domain-containing protein [Ureaplasma sp.]